MVGRSRVSIEGNDVGEGAPCFIIAEIAQAHDGSLGTAHAYIDAVARAGADAIKFQTHIAAAESTPDEPWRVKFSPQDNTRYEYWQRMEFSDSQWKGLADHAREAGLVFLSSAFSPPAVQLLQTVGVGAWKIASGETTNTPMLDRMAATGKPVLISTGMSTYAEIDAAVDRVRSAGAPVAVFQCTSSYPCPPELIGLNVLDEFRQRYGCPVGLSDHSGSIYPPLSAAGPELDLLEVHVTFSRETFGPDVPSSITLDELRSLVEGVRMIEAVRGHPVDKDEMAAQLEPMRALFTKSVVARTAIPTGTTLTEDDLALKKPGGGIGPDRMTDLVGRTTLRDFDADEPIDEAGLR